MSRHDIAGIWVAFFSRCQRYRCGQGVDYFDAATVRCTNGATMAISGAATALAGVGTRVEIFGEQGTLVYDGSSVTVSVRGGEGEPNVSRHDIAGIWVAFFSRCQRYRC